MFKQLKSALDLSRSILHHKNAQFNARGLQRSESEFKNI